MSVVDVVVPCFNGAKYLDRFFLSLLKQTFQDFEIFFVDDGSTDNTKEVVDKYVEIFKEKDINVNYFYKENGGAASAVNVALKQNLTGKYLLIMDCDDEITEDCLQLKVDFMENNPEYGAVTSYYSFIDNETNQEVCINKCKGISDNKLKTFKNFILVNNVVYCGFFYNKEKLFSVLKNAQIFESHGGQNWQLILPVAYNFKIGKIKKVLYNYYLINTSHSHCTKKTRVDLEQKYKLKEEILLNTLERIGVEKSMYRYVEKYKLNSLINCAYEMKDKQMMSDYYNEYAKNGFFNIKLFIKYILVKLGLKK